MTNELEQNKAKAKEFIEAIGSQDGETIFKLYAENATFWQIGRKLSLSGSHTLEETARLTPPIFAKFPNGMEFTIIGMVAEGNKVAVEAESNAVLANGTPYNNQYHFLFIFGEDGRIVEFKEYWDTLHAFETLFDGKTELE